MKNIINLKQNLIKEYFLYIKKNRKKKDIEVPVSGKVIDEFETSLMIDLLLRVG